MIPDAKLQEIADYAKSAGFRYEHNTDCSWTMFVDLESNMVCVNYDNVLRTDGVYIEFLCGDEASAKNARIISKHLPEAIKIAEMLEDAIMPGLEDDVEKEEYT